MSGSYSKKVHITVRGQDQLHRRLSISEAELENAAWAINDCIEDPDEDDDTNLQTAFQLLRDIQHLSEQSIVNNETTHTTQ